MQSLVNCDLKKLFHFPEPLVQNHHKAAMRLRYIKHLRLINSSQYHSLCTIQYQVSRKHSANIYPMNTSFITCSSLQGNLRGEGGKKSNMFQNKDNNTTFTKYYIHNRTQNWKKKLFGKFSVLQKKSVSIVFETYFPLNVFTARHIFQWVMFNNWVVTLFRSWLLIACSFHRISEIANQIVFQSSFSM